MPLCYLFLMVLYYPWKKSSLTSLEWQTSLCFIWSLHTQASHFTDVVINFYSGHIGLKVEFFITSFPFLSPCRCSSSSFRNKWLFLVFTTFRTCTGPSFEAQLKCYLFHKVFFASSIYSLISSL